MVRQDEAAHFQQDRPVCSGWPAVYLPTDADDAPGRDSDGRQHVHVTTRPWNDLHLL